MADIKISDMTTATSVADADVVPVVQGGANKKSAFSVIKAYVQAAFDAIYVPLSRTLTINGVAHDLSTDRSWTVAGGSIANTTQLLKGDGSGDAIATDLRDDGLGDLIFEKETNGLPGFQVLNNTNNTAAGAQIGASANVDGSAYFTLTAYSSSFDLTGYIFDQKGAALTADKLTLSADSGIIRFSIDGGSTEIARFERTFILKPITTPSSPIEGMIYANSTDHHIYFYNGTIWQDLGPSSTTQIGGITFALKRSAGVTTGKLGGYWTCPYAGNITAWNLTVDAGTVTIKVWRKAAGTAHPTSSDSINTSGLSLSTGTHLRSTTLSDFTSTVVTAGDTFAIEVTAVSGVFDLGGSIEITH